jgi:hypothetical protein
MNNNMIILLDRCFECGTIGKLDFHHVVPKSKGGTKMIPLCLLCHSKVHGEHMLEFRLLGAEARKKKLREHKEKGIKHNFGRKTGTIESLETLLNKPKNIEIVNLLKLNEFTIRDIVEKTNSSLGTVMKLKHIIFPKSESSDIEEPPS